MTSKLCTVAVFALLTVTTPARAAIIEYVNLDFGNGYQEIGNIEFSPAHNSPVGYVGRTLGAELGGAWVYFDGSRLPPPPPEALCCGTKIPGFIPQLFSGPSGNPSDDVVFFLDFPDNRLPLTFSDFRLNTVTAVSGDVSIVPVPAALPLFGCAVLGLGAFAWRRKVSA